MLARTQDEIVTRIEARKENDFFGFETSCYLHYLDFAHAKPYLKDEVTKDQWEQRTADPVDVMLDYMAFAWRKANNQRGLSAGRSLQKSLAWIWLAGHTTLHEQVTREYTNNYHHYGKPILEMICDHYGWDWKRWDDGQRTNG